MALRDVQHYQDLAKRLWREYGGAGSDPDAYSRCECAYLVVLAINRQARNLGGPDEARFAMDCISGMPD